MTTDIPAIAVQFHNILWRGMTQPIIAEGKKPTRRSFDPSDLEIMENDLRFILAAGAHAGKLRVTGGQWDIVVLGRISRTPSAQGVNRPTMVSPPQRSIGNGAPSNSEIATRAGGHFIVISREL